MGSVLRRGGRRVWAVLVALCVVAQTLGAQSTKGATQHGRVVDADGKPVAGAVVDLVGSRGFEPKVLGTATSDSKGEFEFATPEDNSAKGPRYQVQSFMAGKGVGQGRYERPDQWLVQLMPATRITLSIEDPEGKPVAGMKVYPMAFVSHNEHTPNGIPIGKTFFIRTPREIWNQMAGTTNDKGEVTLSDIPRGSRFELGFDDERFADPGVYNRIATSESDPVNPPTTVRLEAGARITGVVRFSSTGKAAADIEVAVESTNRTPRGSGGTGFTDAAGSYRISHLAPGEYNLLLHLDRETNQHWTAAAHEWVKVTGGQSLKDMDFALIEGGVIKGRVITADTAEALSGTMVGVYGPSHPRSSSSVQATQTDADGAYMLRIPPGAQHVYVMGGVPGAYRTLKPPFQDLKVEDGETVRVDFRLQRQDGETVNGIVIGLDGKPAAGIIVQVQTGTDISGFKSTHTDAQGRFHFDALPAAAPIEVKNGDLGTAEPAYARKGQSEIRLQLVRRMKLNLKGLVTDDDAKPLAGARVWLSTTYGNFGLGTGEPIVTAADGTYELKNVYADNQYHVSAHAEGFGGAGAPLDLPTGARDAPTLKLPRETTTIRGAVVDETGKPVPKAMVRMTNGMAPKTCETDGQGKFSFSAVAGKNYLITAVVKQQGNFPPHASGIGGGDEVKLVLPRDER